MAGPKDIIRRSKRDKVPSVLQFPRKLGAHAMLMVFKKYEYKRPGTRALNKVGASTLTSQNLAGQDAILLPLPANIEDTYSVRVQGADIGITGALTAGVAGEFAESGLTVEGLQQAAASQFGLATDVVKSILGNQQNENNADIAFLARRALDNNLFSGASRALDIGLGNTINPKAALYFDGMTLKQPNFNWTLAPTNEQESDDIRSISNTIKRNVLPTYGDAGGLARTLLNYPSMVDIFFFGIDQSYFTFYKTCMVQTFNTNFTPQGLAVTKGGKPAMVTMNMGLIEADIHTAEDYPPAFPGLDGLSAEF